MATKTSWQEIANFVKTIGSLGNNGRFVWRMARISRNIIYKRTKAGYGVNSLTSKRPNLKILKPLSDDYKEQRRETGVPGKFGSPDFSNLTYSGQMLEALSPTAGKGFFGVNVLDTRRRDSNLTNAELAEKVQQEGRPFFRLANTEQRIIESEANKTVLDIYRNFF